MILCVVEDSMNKLAIRGRCRAGLTRAAAVAVKFWTANPVLPNQAALWPKSIENDCVYATYATFSSLSRRFAETVKTRSAWGIQKNPTLVMVSLALQNSKILFGWDKRAPDNHKIIAISHTELPVLRVAVGTSSFPPTPPPLFG